MKLYGQIISKKKYTSGCLPLKNIISIYHTIALYTFPLKSKTKKIIGIFVAKSCKLDAFAEDHLTILRSISSYLTVALENTIYYNQLIQQSHQLQEMDRMKTRFYTNISHEFRTPLSLILGPSNELIKNQNLSAKDKNYLEIVIQNSKRLLRLVSQILDLSKLDDGVLRLEVGQGDITKSIKDIVESFRYMADQNNIDLEFKAPKELRNTYFDQDKIEKIIYNLLNNSFKYSNSGDSILVKISFINGGKDISIVVLDTGIGIPENEADNIFDTYYRIENKATQQQFGAGIGLSLVKQLVELHHGKINLKSRENEGTSFEIVFPISIEEYGPEERATGSFQPRSKENTQDNGATLKDMSSFSIQKIGRKKIMIIEDNQDLLTLMANSLQDEFDIIKALDGIEALTLLNENTTPDIIITDVMMPRMNGLEFTENVKKADFAHIPIIILSAKSSYESQSEGLTHGADAYISKPVDFNLLRLRIKNLINTSEKVRNKYESSLFMNLDQLEVGNRDEIFLKNVVSILEKNISNKNVNIDLFTSELGMSRTLLYEKIKKATGESMVNFIKKNRLNYAVKLLLENNFNTSQLAYKVGFNDPKYFAKCFKRQFGKTPKEYLKDKVSQERS